MDDEDGARATGAAAAVIDWLIREARFIAEPDDMMTELAHRLNDAGLPLDRMTGAMSTLYASRRGIGRHWTREGGIRELDFPWDNEAVYQASPFYPAHESRQWVSFHLDEVDDAAFGVVPDLRADGYAEYICIPIFFHDGTAGGMTFATRRASGFSTADRAILRTVEPVMGLVFDLRRTFRLLGETLSMYVGEEPHARILSGQVRRGDVMRIRSAIVFADMRGFTALSTAMTAEETVALLNRYFDCVVPPVEALGGQVLKYIGDGVLAIFRAEDDGAAACAAALQAAEAVVQSIDRARAGDGPSFDVKIALHYGEVAYGNIGSGARLDYTVVGSGVNLASRLADLAGRLDRRLVVSADFAAILPARPFATLGEHSLHGVAGPQAVFEPTT